MDDLQDDLIELDKLKFVKDKCVENNLLEETEDIMLYSNMYPIIFTKDIDIYEYPFSISPKVYEENVILKIFREASKELFPIYGYYYRSGPTFFSLKKIEEEKIFSTTIYNKGQVIYKLKVHKHGHHSTIKKGQTHDFSEIDEKCIFLIIREILQANKNVHFDRDNLYLENKKKEIKGENNKYFIHDGYKISIQQTDIGICLIIGIKNKIKGQFTVLDMIKRGVSLDDLCGRRFIPFEGSRHQQIYEFSKDRNPMNTVRQCDGHSMTYYDYYKKELKYEIKDKEQPLIIVINKKNKISSNNSIKYYIPELSTMIGINEEDSNNNSFMKKIIERTRFEPDTSIKQIEKCLDLFYDKDNGNIKTSPITVEVNMKKKENLNTIKEDECKTSDQKRREYGIEIKKQSQPIKPYYIKQPTFNNGKKYNLTIKDISKLIPVGRECISSDDWICLYYEQVENASYKLLNGFRKCSKKYGIHFKNDNSNWIPMNSIDSQDWINKVETELKYRKTCKFVMFLLDKNTNNLYTDLKRHSLSENGYISQVINSESISRMIGSRKGPDSYFSKILLQINNKLGGCNYFLNIDSIIDDRNIMLIGIDSSHIWAQKNNSMEERTGFAMVSTKDKQFSKIYCKEYIIPGDEHYNSEKEKRYHSFIKEAYAKYLKENNKIPPKNVIIYRQGIAYNQLEYVEDEVKLIRRICNELKINYYFVNVNTRVTTKLFEYNNTKDETNKGEHKNPEQGLVILDQITNYKKFEFYIQPQKVNLGSATPTYFHVPYGNMDFPELLIRLTYWTTYLYPNWQNAVRVPHVIKMAEKLAYMTAKFTRAELNENLSEKQSFL